MRANPTLIGVISLPTGTLAITDPCYLPDPSKTFDEDLAVFVDGITPGDYLTYITYIKNESRRVGKLIIVFDKENDFGLSGKVNLGTVGVDSGQMSFLDKSEIANWGGDIREDTSTPRYRDPLSETRSEFNYAGACSTTLAEPYGGVIGPCKMAVSNTGWGDGAYHVYGYYSRNNNLTSVHVDFDDIEED